jgi:hypothetical protein
MIFECMWFNKTRKSCNLGRDCKTCVLYITQKEKQKKVIGGLHEKLKD